MIKKVFIALLFLLLAWPPFLWAQQSKEEDKSKNNNLGNKVTNRVKSLLYQNPGDTVMDEKSEAAYKRYEGRIIRKITITHIGFERNIDDTTRYKVVNDITRIANSLHSTTKTQVIRNNLFIKAGKPLDPYKLADNERYLRDLNFILDARIVVKPVRGNRQLVDIEVFTRDVFSLGGSFNPRSTSSYRFRIYDANISGQGQGIQFNGVVDTDRDPPFGYQLLYTKNSIRGSFVNASVAYTQINSGSSYGFENEHAVFVKFDRPLVSPYTRWAGGMEWSRNWSTNVFIKPDTSFRKYTYTIKDFWIGYNIGIKNKTENRNRHFVAIRTFNQRFSEQPIQDSESMNPIYNNRTSILGSFTFYNQNFYRTKYVYGFGRTEDVPYGRRITLLAGQIKQFGYSRPYFGVEFEKSVFGKKGDFHEYSLRAGGFKNNSELEDVALLASVSLFRKLVPWKGVKIRQSASIGYSAILNQNFSLPLRINNEFGINRFENDSLVGTQRLGMSLETLLFIRPSLFGFNFAPFAFTQMAMIAPKNEPLFRQKAYFGLGGGIRTRNENLIFGTIELRFFYFPLIVEDLSHFRVTLSSNLRVKYTSEFVKAPAFISYN